MLGSREILLIRVVCFLVIVIIAGSNCEQSRAPLLPLSATFAAFLSAFAGGFGRCHCLLPGNIFPSHRTMIALIASSLEACQVAISSSTLVVFD
jgi:hypothetical protein